LLVLKLEEHVVGWLGRVATQVWFVFTQQKKKWEHQSYLCHQTIFLSIEQFDDTHISILS